MEGRRLQGDRRKRPTPLLSRYIFFGGRRKGPRRSADRTVHVFSDVYSGWLFMALVGLAVLGILDSFFTLALLQGGVAVEANPVMAYFLHHGSTPFLFSKYSLTILSVLAFCLCKNISIARAALAGALILYGSLVLYELGLLSHAGLLL
jgi:hypothetical protein